MADGDMSQDAVRGEGFDAVSAPSATGKIAIAGRRGQVRPPKMSRRQLQRNLVPNVDAALQNEEVTRKRVTVLEQWGQATHERVETTEAWAVQFGQMSCWRRLRWIITGHFKMVKS